MARILRDASLLKRALLGTQVAGTEILEASSQLCHFTSKAKSKPTTNPITTTDKNEKPSLKPVTDLKQITFTKPNTSPKPILKRNANAKPDTNPKPILKPNANAKPDTNPKPILKPNADAKPLTKSKPNLKPDTNSIPKPIKNTKPVKKDSKSKPVVHKEEKLSKKDIALSQALDQITSSFGNGAIMYLGRSASVKDIPVISTGSVGLDIALGVGGLPKGRVVEIFGPEASGKTTLALHVIAQSQKQGGCCVFIDAEHALDPTLAQSIGVKTEDLLVSQPDCGEQALSLVDTLIRSGSVDVIVVDSVAALVPKGELDGEMGDSHVAMQARLMSQALRKLSHSLSQSQTLLIFINQVRAKISTFGFGGPTEVTCGGNALKFYASVRLNIRRIAYAKKSQTAEEIIGTVVQVKVIKNKVSPPFKTAEFEISFGKGISRESEIIDFGVKFELMTKNTPYYKLNETTFHGKERLRQYLEDNVSVREILASKIKEKIREVETGNITGKSLDEDGDKALNIVSAETSDEDSVAGA